MTRGANWDHPYQPRLMTIGPPPRSPARAHDTELAWSYGTFAVHNIGDRGAA
jgi:hypothetical protein